MTRRPTNLGASAQAKLRNLAQKRGDDVPALVTQFVLERLLYRLAASTHAGHATHLASRRSMVVTTTPPPRSYSRYSIT